MSDHHYNLRPRPTVTATEGMDVEQTPEGPGPMVAELPGPAPTQVEEGQATVVDMNVEGCPESPQAVAPSLVSTSISLQDVTLISDLGDEPSPTLEDAGLAIGPLPTDMVPRTPTTTLDADTTPIAHLPPTQYQDTNITHQLPSLAPNVVTYRTHHQ